MDITETYLKMCEKAVEIQNIKHKEDKYHSYFKHGDLIYWNNNFKICTEDYNVFFNITDKVVWLPRQDQLQDMVWNKYCIDNSRQSYSGHERTEALVRWINDAFHNWNFNADKPHEHSYKLNCDSMEQLWLSFVQDVLYQKVWDSTKEGWVTI